MKATLQISIIHFQVQHLLCCWKFFPGIYCYSWSICCHTFHLCWERGCRYPCQDEVIAKLYSEAVWYSHWFLWDSCVSSRALYALFHRQYYWIHFRGDQENVHSLRPHNQNIYIEARDKCHKKDINWPSASLTNIKFISERKCFFRISRLRLKGKWWLTRSILIKSLGTVRLFDVCAKSWKKAVSSQRMKLEQ